MDLTSFELAVYRRDRETALPRLLEILREVATQPIHDGTTSAPTLADRKLLYTRLAAAITALLADPDTKLNDVAYQQLLVLGNVTANIFAASAFGFSDHALRCMGALPGTGQSFTLSGPQASAKLHSAYSLDSTAGLDFAGMMQKPPALRLLLFLKYLSTKPILTLAGHQRREQLLGMADRLEAAPLPSGVDHLVQASNAFMLCSYAEHPRKHAVKSTLSASVREWMLRRGLSDAALPAKRELRARPTMLVASEFMHSGHVQYRYFGQWLRQLAQRFRLVLLTEDSQVDDACRKLFDRVHSFSRSHSGDYLDQAVAFIKSLAPDIIFYPSVGMKHWGVALASLRLAPIQFTALGHSASTFCPAIDYYVIERGYVSDPALFSEKVVILPDESLRFERFPGLELPAPDIRRSPSPLRVALPSNLLKLNPRFLSMCRKISDASPRPLEFHAFPNARLIEGDVAVETIQRWLPGSKVHSAVGYTEYLARLNACDMVLSPSPFGGLHSVVDSLRQGLPVLARECAEPHGRTDAMLLRRLGMPEWTICQSDEQYVETALRLTRDDGLRVALSQQALDARVDEVLFGDGTTPLRREVLDAISWVYENHEAIQVNGGHVWEPSPSSQPPSGAAAMRSRGAQLSATC